MERAGQFKPERQAGAEILPGEEPDYPALREHALGVLGRAHDLRAAVFLSRALLRTEGIEGFAQAVSLLRGLLEQWWPSCHPMLDADDDNDPTARINAVLGLVDTDSTLRALMLAPMAQSQQLGRVTLRDIAMSLGEIAAEDTAPDAATIAAVFRDTESSVLQSRQAAVLALRRDLAAINAVFDQHTPGQGPDLAPLERLLRRAALQFAESLGREVELETSAAPEAGSEQPPPPPLASSGAINSLADVRASLDRIIAFYAAQEPSSPLPILLKRARKLVGADFLTIMKEIAPSGVENVRFLAGLPEGEE